LFVTLKKLDSNRASSIDPQNKVRIIRAIEIAKALSKVPQITHALPPYEFIKIGLYLPTQNVNAKVEKRVAKMFRQGLLHEIKKLKRSGVSNRRLKELGFEYYEPTFEKVVAESIKYAKRQMTWFKRDKEIIWFDASKDSRGRALNYLSSMI
jgi:tRNA dimethylallyltransferase